MSWVRTRASASAMVALGGRITGSLVIRPPAVSSAYSSSRRTGAASSGSISSEQPFGVGGRQLGQQVGGVVGTHRLEHVGRAVLLQAGQDRDLVVLGQLLQDVGEPLVVQGGGHLVAALARQVVHDVGEVGRAQLLEHRQHVGGALAVLGQGEPFDLVPLQLAQRLTPTDALAADLDGDPGQVPVAVAALLHRGVEDRCLGAGVDDGDLAVEQLGQHQGLAGPGVEAAQADGSRTQHHRVAVGGRHPADRHEDGPPVLDLDDQSEHAGRLAADAQGHDGITHPADLVALRVEDGHTGKARDVDPARRAAHGVEVTARLQRRSGSDPLTSRHADTALPPGGRLHRPALRRQPAGGGPRRRRARHHGPGPVGAAVRPCRDCVSRWCPREQDKAAGADYRLRVFTPWSELAFAGHASIGTAWVLAKVGRISPGLGTTGLRRRRALAVGRCRRRSGRADRDSPPRRRRPRRRGPGGGCLVAAWHRAGRRCPYRRCRQRLPPAAAGRRP